MVAASGDKMLLDTIATIILAGMMLIPVVNVFAGVIVGAGLGGTIGAIVGLLLALSIMAVESFIATRLSSFERKREIKRARAARAPPPAERPYRHPDAALAGAFASRASMQQADLPLAAHHMGEDALEAPLLTGVMGATRPYHSSASIS